MFDFVFMSAAVDIDVYGWHPHKHSDLFEAQYNLNNCVETASNTSTAEPFCASTQQKNISNK